MTTMPTLPTRNVLLRRPAALHGLRRGNALVLVTAVLVLLVIIATAYISRAQSIRAIASTQRQILGRGETVELSTGVVADVIAADLFPRLVRADDPGIDAGQVSTSSTPRPLVDQVRTNVQDFSTPGALGYVADVPITRYMNDPQGFVDATTGVKQFVAPYNYAPYETKPWTNWPDGSVDWLPLGRGAVNGFLYDALNLAIGDDNPIGNPGFGDSRWLRSSEPQRSYDQFGWQIGETTQSGQPANGVPGFTHWAHLSWIPDASNGWRVCYDISNVAPYNVDLSNPDDPDPKYGFTLTTTAAQLLANGVDYADAQIPLALQTPYEQWLAGTTPAPFIDAADFINRRDNWFGSPRRHFFALATPDLAMPNLIRLNDLGPPGEVYERGTNRNVVERTLTDTDGDGWTDSFWYLLPGTTEDGVRQVASVSIVDNASRVDVNVATRFDRWSTAGQTPADVALVGRLVDPSFQLQAFGENASAYDSGDTWTGLFADPQNVWPQVAGQDWGFAPRYQTSYGYQVQVDDDPESDELFLDTAYDPYRFGDSTLEPSTWLERIGVTAYDPGTDTSGLADPYNSLLVAISQNDPDRGAFDRRRYFNRRQNTGGLYTIRTDSNGANIGIDDWELGALSPQGFTDADELELRMFEFSNFAPVVSSLERAINRPWDLESNLLRSTLTRAESVEPHLEYFNGNPSPNWPPPGFPVGDQLTGDQLLRDTRHRMTTYSTTRNDVRPLHLRPTSEFNISYDYAFGRTFGGNSGISGNRYQVIQGTGGTPDEQRLMRSFSKAAYEARNQKIDLRAPLDTPLTEFEALLYQGVDRDGNGTIDAQRPAFPDVRYGVAEYFEDNRGASDRIYPGLWPGNPGSGFDQFEADNFRLRVELDRAWRFRQDLQELLQKSMIALDDRGQDDQEPRTQSYWGSNFLAQGSGGPSAPATNGRAARFTSLMTASWAANIDSFRDDRPRPVAVKDFTNFTIGSPVTSETTVFVDAPIFPFNAPGIDSRLAAGLPSTMQDVVFPGLEAQPVIMEAFFSLVYPPSRLSDELIDALQEPVTIPGAPPGSPTPPWYQVWLQQNGDDSYEDIDFDSEEFRYEIPKYFEGYPSKFVDRSSAPAIVFAIQIANPFNDPVPLQDVVIEIGGETAQTKQINLAQLPSPQINPNSVVGGACIGRTAPYFHPTELYLGPTLPEAPRTAIIFGVIPPRGVTPANFQNTFRVSYSQFHARWMDFMDLEPGALFGWEPGDAPCDLQTLVFDASPQTFFRPQPWTTGGGGEIATTTLPRLASAGWGTSTGDDGAISDSATGPWFDDVVPDLAADAIPGQTDFVSDPTKGSVRLLRRVFNPLTYDANRVNLFDNDHYFYEIDRLDNVFSDGEALLSSDLERLTEDEYRPPVPDYGPKAVGSSNFPYPPGGTAQVDGIVLGQGSFFMTWARAGRPWGWDVNRNGVYDMGEISPRFAFSDFPGGDIVDTEVEEYRSGAPVGVIGGTSVKGKVVSLQQDPDNLNVPGVGWPIRSYITPLAITRAGLGGIPDGEPYSRDFQVIRSKPVNFTTATHLPAVGGGTPNFDAGFPVLRDGTVRVQGRGDNWPGGAAPVPVPRTVLMDKGQKQVTSTYNLPGASARAANPTGTDVNQDGLDDGLALYQRTWLEKDKWAYPLQMLVKNDDFEQIGELNNVFLWGPAVKRPESRNGRLWTAFTFGEAMASETAPFGPSLDNKVVETYTPPVRRAPLRNVGPPTLQVDLGVRTNRFNPDPGNLVGGSTFARSDFRPPTQVPELTTFTAPWTPLLPSGLALFDGVVCDGPGANYNPDLRTLAAESGPTLEPLEQVAIDDARFGNAAGFSGDGTRGLINVNTASIEVLRTLPHMSRLVYNDRTQWPDLDGDAAAWSYPTSLLVGDVDAQGRPLSEIGRRNPQWVRIPEAIDRYRDGAGITSDGRPRQVQIDQLGLFPFATDAFLPSYDDRGSFYANGPQMAEWANDPDSPETRYVDLGSAGSPGYFPGMRRTRGFASTGELMLLGRTAVQDPNGRDWPARAISIDAGGADPFRYQRSPAFTAAETVGGGVSLGEESFNTAGAPWSVDDNTFLRRLGLGWRPAVDDSGFPASASLQADTRLATDRQGTRWRDITEDANGNFFVTLDEIPDTVAGDAEEKNLLFAGLSNLVSVRSDTFTVHMKVRSFQRNPITGVWDATDPEYVVDEARYVFVVDRSKCDKPSDEPEIRLMSRIPR